ncbi:MAG: Ribosomally synthesized peptide [candidate division NC10 bacterium]|nr:Ribosomally synthesized peptide [candidate division NC10 bacterium]
MSQAAVEKAIGKLVTDDTFRARFFADPPGASLHAGLELSGAELAALVQFSRRLDDRLRRLCLDAGAPAVKARRLKGTTPQARNQRVG